MSDVANKKIYNIINGPSKLKRLVYLILLSDFPYFSPGQAL